MAGILRMVIVCVTSWLMLIGTGNVETSSWFDHVKPWWEHRGDANILFITYEEMKQDLAPVVRKIAHFIGIENVTDDLIQRVVDMSSFEAMKSDDKANHSWLRQWRREDGTPFMRKGIVGLDNTTLNSHDCAHFPMQETGSRTSQKTSRVAWMSSMRASSAHLAWLSSTLPSDTRVFAQNNITKTTHHQPKGFSAMIRRPPRFPRA